MSGATIGGVVGAVVGSFIPGVGTQLGWMIGSAIGGYVDPEQVSQFGPRLTDAQQQTARDGIPIPYGYGTFSVHGNIIWCGPVVEHVNESTDDGKGSGVETTTTTYTYTRSYAIGICQGEIAGLRIIKRNGKIIFDARTDAELTAIGYTATQIAQARSAAASANVRFIVYTGSETQTADPTIEAHEGVGNVPGFRGLAYIVVTDDDVTELRGAVPQYEFVVAADGTATSDCSQEAELIYHAPLNDAARNGTSVELIAGRDGVYSDTEGVGAGPALVAGGGSSFHMQALEDYMVYDSGSPAGIVGVGSLDEWTASVWFRITDELAGTQARNVATFYQDTVNPYVDWGLITDGTDSLYPRGYYSPGSGTYEEVNSPTALSVGQTVYMVMTWEADSPGSSNGTQKLYINGVLKATNASAVRSERPGRWMAVGGFAFPESYGMVGYVQHVKLYGVALTQDEIDSLYLPASDYLPIPGADGWFVDRFGNVVNSGACVDIVEGDNPTLDTIVAAEFQRVGLTSDDYDVSDLAGIEVLGYRVLPNGSGVDAALGPLMQAYFFDIAEWDGKLRCVLRGGSSSLSLTMDDLAERDGEALEWTRVQEAELLRLQTIAYIDPVAGYTPTTQKWERRAGTVQAKGEAAVEVPITATADTAAGIAKKRGLIAWAETEKAKLSLPYRRAKVTPTDVLTLTDDAGEAHRLRVGQIEDDSGVRLLEVTKERGNVYGATASGVNPNNPTLPDGAGLVGPTILYAMNLPRLRSGDNQPGAYVAATGVLPGWKGADIYVSADGGVSFQFGKRILSRATMGELAASCTASSEPITVTLYDNRSLSSITADQLAARQNGFAITTDATSEVGQFQTATESGDDWELTDTVRGSLGAAAAAHDAGDAFVLLDQAVQFMPLDISLAGRTLILRAVSLGTSPDDNETKEFLFDPLFTGPEELDFLLDEAGERLLDESGVYLLEE